MECIRCGKFYPADPETGYDVDALCPDCEDVEPEDEPDDDDPRRV